MTYGLRWDIDFAPSSTSGPNFIAVTGFNLSDLSNLAFGPANTPPYKTKYGNFAPRIGLAYQLSERQDRQTILRGGVGLFYDLATAEAGNALPLLSYPFGTQPPVSRAPFPFTSPAGDPPPITPPPPGARRPSPFRPPLHLPHSSHSI